MNTSFLTLNTANNSSMNTSSIDALAEVALKREMPTALSTSSLSTSLLASQDSSGSLMKLSSASNPNIIAANINARFPSFSMVPTSSMPMNQGVANNGSDGNAGAIYLSILNEHRRRSMTDLNSPGMPITAQSAVGIVGSDPTFDSKSIPSQSSGVSAASNYASVMQSRFDSTITAPSRRRKANFAEKLHAVLSDKDCRHAIAWLPSGRSFCITDQDEFVKKILPKFFREAKFESFSRRLKRWGFRKVYTMGLSQIIFSHDLFHRDRPDLCKIMNGREKIVNSGDHTVCTQGTAASGGVDSFASQNQFRNALMFQQAQAQNQQQHHQAAFQAMQQMNQQRASLAAQGTQQVPSVSAGCSPRNSFLSQNPVVLSLRGSSTSPTGSTRAILSEASALVLSSMPNDAKGPQAVVNVNANDPSTIQVAKMQLTKLNDDIANCEEQLTILQQLKELKEKRRMLTGTVSPSGISSPSAPSNVV